LRENGDKMKYYFAAIKKYSVVKGRSSRKEFWFFFLINIIIGFSIFVITSILYEISDIDLSILFGLYHLFILLPSFSITVRRIHDSNHNGLWIFVPIINIIFLLLQGTEGENRFGPDPNAIGV
jgi:uncharacterized membrane protein YhaH (DUF805 family)